MAGKKRGKGYTGRILLVDLSTREVEERTLPDELYQKYLMGSGLGARLMRAGDRIFTLKRLYNTRLGVSREDDQLPHRILTLQKRGEELPNIPPEAFRKMMDEYYEIRGWTSDGQVTSETLSALDLSEVKEVVFA